MLAENKEQKDCAFCKIVKGKIPCAKVYENDKVIAFLDINPVNHGHTLIMPKKHYELMQDIPDDILSEIIITIKKLTPAIIKAVDSNAFNLGLNNGRVAGQLVPHAHFHIMPRFKNDGHKLWYGKNYNEGDAEEIAAKIRNLLK